MNVRIADLMHFQKLSMLLHKLRQDSDNVEETLNELANLLPSVSKEIIERLLPSIFVVVKECFSYCGNSTGADQRKKCLVVDVLNVTFSRTQVTSFPIFFQFYMFLLNGIYDARQPDNVANVHEEYKLSIMTAMVTLSKSLTYEAKQELYTFENAFCLTTIICTALSLAKNEKLKSLRLTAIECIMSFAQICDIPQSQDQLTRKQVADIFVHMAPGIISGLSNILREDHKCGHQITLLAFRALGRFIVLLMENYTDIEVGSSNFAPSVTSKSTSSDFSQGRENVINTLKSKKIDAEWYKNTEEKLCQIFTIIANVTWHTHQQVRLEVANNLVMLVEHCPDTMPNFVSKALEVLIKLSEDESDEISTVCKVGLKHFQEKMPATKLKDLLESLEEAFFASLTTIPRIFNSFDEEQQLSCLNLLVGYLRLFGSHMPQILQSVGHSQRLIDTLIHISEFERKDVRFFEEYGIQELELINYSKAPWKNFLYLNSEAVQRKLETACEVLAKFDENEQISYLLLDIFVSSEENRREVTYILNNMIAGIPDEKVQDHCTILKNVAKMYMEPEYWRLPLEVSYKCQMFQVQYNVIQVCLQLEGIGQIAAKLKEEFKYLLLPTLAPILERAGSSNSLVKQAGITAIANISKACGYETSTLLIKDNYDYLSFYINNKIRKSEESITTISILTTILRYSDLSNLSSVIDFIRDVLDQTYYKYFQEDSANVYLYLFNIFIKAMHRWFSIEILIPPIKSKQQLADEYVQFQVSNLHVTDECEDERPYKDDSESEAEDCFEDEESELLEMEPSKSRPEHVVLLVDLLNRVLHFLPSKDKSRKILVLDILIDGLEVLRDWEDDLLPLVHKIWGPLVERFKEKDECLIVHRSFQLLVTLARLSKDFIRSRTVKDILPHVLNILTNLAEHSYLKDHGAAYRYTQAYKLQLCLLQHLSRLIIDIDADDSNIKNAMGAVMPYLSNKQPVPLQQASVGYFNDVLIYDRALVTEMLQKFLKEEREENLKEFRKNIESILRDITTNSNT